MITVEQAEQELVAALRAGSVSWSQAQGWGEAGFSVIAQSEGNRVWVKSPVKGATCRLDVYGLYGANKILGRCGPAKFSWTEASGWMTQGITRAEPIAEMLGYVTGTVPGEFVTNYPEFIRPDGTWGGVKTGLSSRIPITADYLDRLRLKRPITKVLIDAWLAAKPEGQVVSAELYAEIAKVTDTHVDFQGHLFIWNERLSCTSLQKVEKSAPWNVAAGPLASVTNTTCTGSAADIAALWNRVQPYSPIPGHVVVTYPGQADVDGQGKSRWLGIQMKPTPEIVRAVARFRIDLDGLDKEPTADQIVNRLAKICEDWPTLIADAKIELTPDHLHIIRQHYHLMVDSQLRTWIAPGASGGRIGPFLYCPTEVSDRGNFLAGPLVKEGRHTLNDVPQEYQHILRQLSGQGDATESPKPSALGPMANTAGANLTPTTIREVYAKRMNALHSGGPPANEANVAPPAAGKPPENITEDPFARALAAGVKNAENNPEYVTEEWIRDITQIVKRCPPDSRPYVTDGVVRAISKIVPVAIEKSRLRWLIGGVPVGPLRCMYHDEKTVKFRGGVLLHKDGPILGRFNGVGLASEIEFRLAYSTLFPEEEKEEMESTAIASAPTPTTLPEGQIVGPDGKIYALLAPPTSPVLDAVASFARAGAGAGASLAVDAMLAELIAEYPEDKFLRSTGAKTIILLALGQAANVLRHGVAAIPGGAGGAAEKGTAFISSVLTDEGVRACATGVGKKLYNGAKYIFRTAIGGKLPKLRWEDYQKAKCPLDDEDEADEPVSASATGTL